MQPDSDIITAKHPVSSQILPSGLTITKPGHRDAAVVEVILSASDSNWYRITKAK
jgi:hypothetical protein